MLCKTFVLSVTTLILGAFTLVGCRGDDESASLNAAASKKAQCSGNFVLSKSPNFFPLNAMNLAQLVSDVYHGGSSHIKNFGFERGVFFDDGSAHYGMFYKKELTVLAFRGTDIMDENDRATDLSTTLVQVPRVRGAIGEGRVHSGFYGSVIGQTTRILKLLYDEHEGQARPILLAGHSLGGAIATLFAYELYRQIDLPLSMVLKSEVDAKDKNRTFRQVVGELYGVYLYGAPAVGDATFKAEFNRMGLQSLTFNMEAENDPIANLRPSNDYVTVGTPVFYTSEIRVLNKTSQKSFSSRVYNSGMEEHRIPRYHSFAEADYIRTCKN